MQRTRVNIFLESIHPKVHVVRHSNQGEHPFHAGSDAVYFGNDFIGAIPPGDMYFNEYATYRAVGRRGDYGPNRSLRGIIRRLRQKGALLPHKYLSICHDSTH